MANCPECGTRVSVPARICPGCACPLVSANAAVAATGIFGKWDLNPQRVRLQSILAGALLLEGMTLLAQYLLNGRGVGLYVGLLGVEVGFVWITAIQFYAWRQRE
jgi:hypothetical protein